MAPSDRRLRQTSRESLGHPPELEAGGSPRRAQKRRPGFSSSVARLAVFANAPPPTHRALGPQDREVRPPLASSCPAAQVANCARFSERNENRGESVCNGVNAVDDGRA